MAVTKQEEIQSTREVIEEMVRVSSELNEMSQRLLSASQLLKECLQAQTVTSQLVVDIYGTPGDKYMVLVSTIDALGNRDETYHTPKLENHHQALMTAQAAVHSAAGQRLEINVTDYTLNKILDSRMDRQDIVKLYPALVAARKLTIKRLKA